MGAQHRAQRISKAVDGRVWLESVRVDVAASVGVSYVDRGDSPSADLALSRADEHMHQAKRHRYANEYGIDPGETPSTPESLGVRPNRPSDGGSHSF